MQIIALLSIFSHRRAGKCVAGETLAARQPCAGDKWERHVRPPEAQTRLADTQRANTPRPRPIFQGALRAVSQVRTAVTPTGSFLKPPDAFYESQKKLCKDWRGIVISKRKCSEGMQRDAVAQSIQGKKKVVRKKQNKAHYRTVPGAPSFRV